MGDTEGQGRASAEEVRQERARLKSARDDFERLTAPRDADARTLRRLFVLASRRYHPDRFVDADPALREQVQEIFLQLSEAEQRLRRGHRKVPTIAPPPPPALKSTAPEALGRRAGATVKSSGLEGAVPDALLRRLGIEDADDVEAEATADTIPAPSASVEDVEEASSRPSAEPEAIELEAPELPAPERPAPERPKPERGARAEAADGDGEGDAPARDVLEPLSHPRLRVADLDEVDRLLALAEARAEAGPAPLPTIPTPTIPTPPRPTVVREASEPDAPAPAVAPPPPRPERPRALGLPETPAAERGAGPSTAPRSPTAARAEAAPRGPVGGWDAEREWRWGEALHALATARHHQAAQTLDALLAVAPERRDVQAARELAHGLAARDDGRASDAVWHLGRALVVDGSVREAVEALRRMASWDDMREDRLVARVLGDER